MVILHTLSSGFSIKTEVRFVDVLALVCWAKVHDALIAAKDGFKVNLRISLLVVKHNL